MKQLKIVFIGDSVTDGGRDYRNYHTMGESYPKYASLLIKEAYPDVDIEFINQGINGNRSDQLSDRLYTDAISFDPDIISVLIGVNDIWHGFEDVRIEVSDEQFYANFRAILRRIKEQTNAKLLVLSPFVLDNESKAHFLPSLNRRLPTIKSIALEYADAYVPLSDHFAEAMKTQPEPYYYAPDGVHPNENGASFIGKLYFEAADSLIKDILKNN